MKKLSAIIMLLFSTAAIAQSNYGFDYSIRIEAQTSASPASVTLNWETSGGSGNYSIYRKTKSSNNWGNPIAQPGSTATSYTDNNVTAGNAYEYLINRAGTIQPYGYIYAGIETPAIHSRGAIILLVDNTFSTNCASEIQTLMADLRGDGWEVIRKDFPRSETVANVKNYIVSATQGNSNIKALYILGHISVPHSGNIYPDGHNVSNSPGNPHEGAWPADIYYGELDGSWTDVSVNVTTAGNPLCHNVPGDGKFDQDYIPNDAELQVGRVDLWDMPAFSQTEDVMMQNYLQKAHKYKTGQLTVNKRGLVDDNFKNMQEGFSGNGWRNISPLCGVNNVSEKDFISTLNTDFYQWAYGTGAGSFTNCNGVGNTAAFANNNMKTIFTMLFGSYFGDWEFKNNLLRAPLCSADPALTSCWAGRPNWFFHHMALGENIGYSTLLSQNNGGIYATPIPTMRRMVHVALMGDPSLRTEYVQPVTTVSTTTAPESGATITWTASAEPGVAGYYVYRSTSEFGEYKIRSTMVNGTSFTDSFGTDGTYWYMVRASKLQQTPSGSYYNMSIGTATSGTFQYPYEDVGVAGVAAITDASLYPNPTKGNVMLTINTIRPADAVITVTGLRGNILYRATEQLIPGSNKHQLNISKLAAGMYMVHINTTEGRKSLKLAKTY